MRTASVAISPPSALRASSFNGRHVFDNGLVFAARHDFPEVLLLYVPQEEFLIT
jgi:hypothetical protein